MTREEAIAFFKDMNECTYGNLEAVEMAIEALEQQPCGDCISRKATVKRLCKVADFMNEKRSGSGSPYIMAALFIQDNKDEFPPVTPKEKTEYEHDHEVVKAYNDGQAFILDKIRAEIDQKQYDFMSDGDYNEGIRFGLMLAYQIIDKYSEVSE